MIQRLAAAVSASFISLCSFVTAGRRLDRGGERRESAEPSCLPPYPRMTSTVAAKVAAMAATAGPSKIE